MFSEMHQSLKFRISTKPFFGNKESEPREVTKRERERESEPFFNKTVENIENTNKKLVALLVIQLPQSRFFCCCQNFLATFCYILTQKIFCAFQARTEKK